MGRKRRDHLPAFKAKAVLVAAKSERALDELARQLDVHLARWPSGNANGTKVLLRVSAAANQRRRISRRCTPGLAS